MNNQDNYLFRSSDTNPSQRAEDELDLRWQYLLDPVAPNWPEPVYSGQPFGATKSTFSSDIELSLWDRDLWEQWDLSYLNASPAPGSESILKSVPPDSALATISQRQLLSPISQISTEGISHGVMSLSKDDYFRANAKCSSVGIARSYAASRSTSADLFTLTAIVPNIGLSAAGPSSKPTSPQTQSASTKPKPMSRATARPKAGSQSRSHKVHNNVERQYRARLNNEYTTLLNALPKDITSSPSVDLDQTLSKIEILDLAKKHIATLEKEEEQLKEEKTMLNGQLQLLKRLVDTLI